MPNDDLDFGETIRGLVSGQKVFNRYVLEKILGRGGMGVVWRAHDETLQQEVAIKMLPEMVAADAGAVKELKRETARSQKLSHPNILRIYDFAEEDRACGITMELVEGGNLTEARVAQSNEVYEPDVLKPWLEQLCQALNYAHSKARIVHRDLKPANLMVDGDGDLKIADFGIAASVSDSVSRVSQQAGTSGTPLYMSPQQMMGEDPSITDDVYAVGATLFELLAGKPPFHTGNVMMQVLNKEAPSLNERRAKWAENQGTTLDPVPSAWEKTIAMCLAKEPSDRPQSAGEVWERMNEASKVPPVVEDSLQAEDCYEVGSKYVNGDGVPQDDVEAVKWFQRAAEQGHVEAQGCLGLAYEHGIGVAVDEVEAVKWYRQAAEQGHGPSQCNLGLMYTDGRGVPEDYVESVKWYRQAAEQGSDKAEFNLGLMYATGSGVPEDEIEAVKWYRLAAEQGNGDAQYHLGEMYKNGAGVPKDEAEAKKWYRLAAEQEHAEAQQALHALDVSAAKEQSVAEEEAVRAEPPPLQAMEGAPTEPIKKKKPGVIIRFFRTLALTVLGLFLMFFLLNWVFLG